ncbi:werner helicase interacting protein [Anopheles darlingi]|uniref:Werner helicase interacting protein n=1 Tax=Anopheles darlingi TaxID=43151 RepID=W5J246_ANODA|nr:werner helicase interacting protein [Anopheles darlingi]
MAERPESPLPCTSTPKSECPICKLFFPIKTIEEHVNDCLEESENICSKEAVPIPIISQEKPAQPKRVFGIFNSPSSAAKRVCRDGSSSNTPQTSAPATLTVPASSIVEIVEDNSNGTDGEQQENNGVPSNGNVPEPQSPSPHTEVAKTSWPADSNKPLAERVRPDNIEDYVGQEQVMGRNAILRKLFDSGSIPSMILWGPPGCGKTTLAHIIANRCKQNSNSMRFVSLSATSAGVNDVKEAVKVAKNESRFKRRTILFLDEIHRFNKLQQDIFLPHVESGTITLIGATTENPSFSLNSALLSRCRVIVLEKHSVESMMSILVRALPQYRAKLITDCDNNNIPNYGKSPLEPSLLISEETVRWLAETCDGDARIGLNSLQLALSVNVPTSQDAAPPKIISLEDVREGLKKSHLLYDRKGDQHYDLISALHKSIRASDDNAALYWVTRMIMSGEDPRYVCRRMIRMASEDIGMADTNALQVATATLTAVQTVGWPEADCIIAHCAVYLARAPKSREVYEAFKECRASIENWKGPMPPVPLHLRNAPTKLMKQLNYGNGYNLMHKDESGLTYMPEGLEDLRYF